MDLAASFPSSTALSFGVLGGVAISVIELFLFYGPKRRLPFLTFVVIKSLTYTIVIAAFVFSVIIVSRSIQFDLTLSETFHSQAFQHFLFHEDFFIIVAYALVFALIVIFTREINVRLGRVFY